MVKKINQDAVPIKSLLSKGYKQADIVKILKVSKQKVHYWVKNPVRTEQKRRKKLNVQYIQKIYTLAKDKSTSEMGSKRIASIINKENSFFDNLLLFKSIFR